MDIIAPIFDSTTAYGIGGLAIVMTIITLIAYSLTDTKHFLLAAAWIAISGFLAYSGIISNFDSKPPPFAFVLPVFIVVAFVIGLSKTGKEISATKSFAILVGLQAFRFPLELIMHRAYEIGIMPQYLSYSGYNYDVATGIGAMILGFMLWRGFSVPHFVIWVWNIWGIICLIVIAIVAVGGSPIAAIFGSEPENLNTWVAFFPYIWLPMVLVLNAIVAHILVTRKLLSKKYRSQSVW